MKYIDVHSHWADPRFSQNDESLKRRLSDCIEKGIDFFLQAGVGPDDWDRQLELKKKFAQHFGLCFGLHPYFVSDHTAEECEAALDELTHVLPEAMALGETGLDFRPHIVKSRDAHQIEMFENQIELAKAFKKPLVLHIVQAHDKALQIMDVWGVPEEKGLVHAFGGSFDTAKKWIDRGFLISVGGAVTFEKNRKLRDCISKLPLEFLLLETDSPDQAPDGWTGLNESTSLFRVAKAVGEIREMNPLDILDINTSNFRRLFKV